MSARSLTVPDDSVDKTFVDRLVAGDGATLVWVTRGERAAAVAILTQQGLTLPEIAARLGCASATVRGYQARAAQAGTATAGDVG